MSEASESPVHDTTKTPVGIEPRPGVTVVDGSNFEDFVQSQLPPAAKVDDDAQEDALDAAAREAKPAATPAPKEGDVDGQKVFFKGAWTAKNSFEYRLHLRTEEKEKEVRGTVDAAKAEAKALRERAEAAERTANELKNKYEPPKSQEIGPEPLPSQFTDIGEYSKALKDWTADSTRKQDAIQQAQARAEQERAQIAKTWDEKLAKARTEIPDYDKILTEASGVMISNDCRDAIFECDNGPEIFIHLAQNPDEAKAIGEMRLDRMHRAIGKLDASLNKGEQKAAPKGTSIAEISKAPAPITPLKGASAPLNSALDQDGTFHGSFEEYKKYRAAGKIK